MISALINEQGINQSFNHQWPVVLHKTHENCYKVTISIVKSQEHKHLKMVTLQPPELIITTYHEHLYETLFFCF